jgi:hypothetical protein
MCEFEYLYKSHIGETTYFSNIYKMEYALLVFFIYKWGQKSEERKELQENQSRSGAPKEINYMYLSKLRQTVIIEHLLHFSRIEK